MKNSPTETRTTLLYSGLLALAIVSACFSLGVKAESEHSNFKYIEPVAETDKAKTPQLEAVEKPSDGKGAMPTFAEADIDNDHYITKAELKNFPYLLQVFDKVDAGEDGKLEQHEYQNLKMETKREAEVR
jgi:hypothetical protein